MTAVQTPPRAPEQTLRASQLAVGQVLPEFALKVTSTVIVAGAIATRDFMPAHHDPVFAKAQGAPDMFMNILSSNAYVSRYLTDWAGPEAQITSIKVRLGVPVVPGQTLRFSGSVAKLEAGADETRVEIALRASNELGDHVTGSAALTLPPG